MSIVSWSTFNDINPEEKMTGDLSLEVESLEGAAVASPDPCNTPETGSQLCSLIGKLLLYLIGSFFVCFSCLPCMLVCLPGWLFLCFYGCCKRKKRKGKAAPLLPNKFILYIEFQRKIHQEIVLKKFRSVNSKITNYVKNCQCSVSMKEKVRFTNKIAPRKWMDLRTVSHLKGLKVYKNAIVGDQDLYNIASNMITLSDHSQIFEVVHCPWYLQSSCLMVLFNTELQKDTLKEVLDLLLHQACNINGGLFDADFRELQSVAPDTSDNPNYNTLSPFVKPAFDSDQVSVICEPFESNRETFEGGQSQAHHLSATCEPPKPEAEIVKVDPSPSDEVTVTCGHCIARMILPSLTISLGRSTKDHNELVARKQVGRSQCAWYMDIPVPLLNTAADLAGVAPEDILLGALCSALIETAGASNNYKEVKLLLRHSGLAYHVPFIAMRRKQKATRTFLKAISEQRSSRFAHYKVLSLRKLYIFLRFILPSKWLNKLVLHYQNKVTSLVTFIDYSKQFSFGSDAPVESIAVIPCQPGNIPVAVTFVKYMDMYTMTVISDIGSLNWPNELILDTVRKVKDICDELVDTEFIV